MKLPVLPAVILVLPPFNNLNNTTMPVEAHSTLRFRMSQPSIELATVDRHVSPDIHTFDAYHGSPAYNSFIKISTGYMDCSKRRSYAHEVEIGSLLRIVDIASTV